MKAIRIITIILVISTVVLSGCAKGNIRGAVRNVPQSYIYTPKEIHDAMDVAMKHFKDHFSGCTLREISYDEEISNRESPDWAAQYGAEEAIVLVSSFYTGWKWILTRSNGGAWTLQTWGYG